MKKQIFPKVMLIILCAVITLLPFGTAAAADAEFTLTRPTQISGVQFIAGDSLTTDKETLSFATLTKGYLVAPGEKITLTNLSQNTTDYVIETTANLSVDQRFIEGLASGASALLTVTPQAGLAVGAYQETVIISTSDDSIFILVTFEVIEAQAGLNLAAASEKIDLGTIYRDPAADGQTKYTQVQIKNNGQNLSGLKITAAKDSGLVCFFDGNKTNLATGETAILNVGVDASIRNATRYEGNITITADNADGKLELPVMYQTTNAMVEITPTSVDLGEFNQIDFSKEEREIRKATFTIQNNSSETITLAVGDLTIGGDNGIIGTPLKPEEVWTDKDTLVLSAGEKTTLAVSVKYINDYSRAINRSYTFAVSNDEKNIEIPLLVEAAFPASDSRPHGCMIVSLFGEDAEQTTVLRDFRDRTLKTTDGGQTLVDAYYAVSPVAVWVLDNIFPQLKPIVAAVITEFADSL
ncbi:MAG: hypothetical protein GXW99_06895 [Clostridiales bacterium]|nr:hypothetical protein [Clostridiales bacterium]